MFQLKYQEREKKVTIPSHFIHMVLKPNCYIQTINSYTGNWRQSTVFFRLPDNLL